MLSLQSTLKRRSANGPLHHYWGNARHSFSSQSASAGLYVIELTVTERDSNIEIYASTTPDSDQLYPLLPNDSNLDILNIKKTSITVSWKRSLSDGQHLQSIQYCAVINQVRQLPTRCAADAVDSNLATPTIPPYAGFGFAWEKNRRYRKPAGPNPFGQVNDTNYVCIGSKTTYTFGGLSGGKRYFLNIYAVNTVTNKSSSYTGSSVRTLGIRRRLPLRNGQITLGSLNGFKSNVLFRYKMNNSERTQRLLIAVNPCGESSVNVQVMRRNHILTSSRIHNLKRFVIDNPRTGTYNIKITSRRRQPVQFTVYASATPSINQSLTNRNGSGLSLQSESTTCNSVKVSWTAPTNKQTYCLYKTPYEHYTNVTQEVPGEEIYGSLQQRLSNMCTRPHRRTGKVICRRFRYKDKRNYTMTQTVGDLLPNRSYLLEVYAKKRSLKSSAFQSILVRTRSQC